jgi:hypothetical protein
LMPMSLAVTAAITALGHDLTLMDFSLSKIARLPGDQTRTWLSELHNNAPVTAQM